MRRKIEALLYGRRWRADEHAWTVWQNLAPLVPTSFSALDSRRPIAGRVYRVYQRAHRGTKAVVHFGDGVGLQDTWWERMRPAANQWVVVRTHLWYPPGTHSGQHVVWIDGWESSAAGDVYIRALRHERRLKKEGLTSIPDPGQEVDVGEARDMAPEVRPGQPLFSGSALAVAADMQGAMSAAAEIANQLHARAYGPAEAGGGCLLFIWLPDDAPTFLSVSARPISSGTVWISVSAQSLAASSLDAVERVTADLRAKLGDLGPGVRPPLREVDYDRGAGRRLEAEQQELLEAVAANPAWWESLSHSIYERELLLQDLTELGI